MKGLMKKPSYTLIFVRHGNTALNEDKDKIRGWKDIPLSPLGEKEAFEIGKRLKSRKIDGIITSDLLRAQQTAKAISDVTGAPIIAATKGFRPLNVGIYQGKESAKVLPEIFEYLKESHKKIPEGESFDDFKKRFLDEIAHLKRMFKNKVIVIVAHHRNNVMLDAWIAKGCKEDYSIDNDKIMQKGIPPADFRVYRI